jgi:hypothetical protein
LIAASILAARKLAQFDGGKKVPATISAVADAVRWAEEIMKAISRPLVDCEMSIGCRQKFQSRVPLNHPALPRAQFPEKQRSSAM